MMGSIIAKKRRMTLERRQTMTPQQVQAINMVCHASCLERASTAAYAEAEAMEAGLQDLIDKNRKEREFWLDAAHKQLATPSV